MRFEAPSTTTNRPSSPLGSRLRGSPRVRAWVWPATLFGISTITSLALAVLASVWLVPVYLIVMVAVLGVPSTPKRRRPIKTSEFSSAPESDHQLSPPSQGEERDRQLPNELGARAQEAPRFEVLPEPDPDFDPDSVKTKRGRGKVRKVRVAALVDSSGPTWVRVGPGKFVRADLLPAPQLEVPEERPKPATLPDPTGEPAEPGVNDPGLVTEITFEGIEETGPEPSVLETETDGDNGIAPDASEVSDSADEPVEVPTLFDSPEQVTPGLALDAAPMRWLPFGRRSTRVANRSERSSRVNPSDRALSRRTDRGARRPVGIGRSHPPRSPPRWKSSWGQDFGFV